MIQQITQQKRQRGPSLETLIFKMGGFNGAVRRVISKWERPFTANQVKVAIVRRHPELLPANFQIEDILSELARIRNLERVDESTYRHARPKFVKAEVSKGIRQLKLTFRI
jgi:hypothetical protein